MSILNHIKRAIYTRRDFQKIAKIYFSFLSKPAGDQQTRHIEKSILKLPNCSELRNNFVELKEVP